MLPFLRISLVAVLVLLQLLSPLVHAHAGQSVGGGADRLHLPGLEGLSRGLDKAAGQVAYYPTSLADSADGVLVAVDSGIKPAWQGLSPDIGHTAVFLAALAALGVYFAASEVNFSPHTAILAYRFSLTAHPPRAPPSA